MGMSAVEEYVTDLLSRGEPLAIYDAGDFLGWLERERGENHYADTDVIHELEDHLRDRIRHGLAGPCDECHGSGRVPVMRHYAAGIGYRSHTWAEPDPDVSERCSTCDGTGEDADPDPTPLLIVGYADGEHERAVCLACGAEFQHALYGFLVVPHRGLCALKCECGRSFPRQDGDLADALPR